MEEDIKNLYKVYNTVIKPLIAEVEARTEQFPLPLFNEIRALHDHISRCYSDDVTEEQIEKNIEKGNRHVIRIILDCYKYLNLSLHDSVMLFERQTRNIDLYLYQNIVFFFVNVIYIIVISKIPNGIIQGFVCSVLVFVISSLLSSFTYKIENIIVDKIRVLSKKSDMQVWCEIYKVSLQFRRFSEKPSRDGRRQNQACFNYWVQPFLF